MGEYLSGDGTAILSGYRILDLSSVIMGPYATQQLGDLGAEIIWVEPIEGSTLRIMGNGEERLSGVALNLLRNKKSISIDLKRPESGEILRKIISSCDALVTNLRPMSLSRLSLDYRSVAAIRPDIVFCQAQGFRSDGERGNAPAYDDIIQAESGIADAAWRADGRPRLAATILADKVCGTTIAQAVIAGLLHRERTGAGQRIEVPMLDVMRSFMLVEHGGDAITVPPIGGAGYNRVLNPERGPQRTLDGWVNIMPYSPAAYQALFRAGGREDLIDDPRVVEVQQMMLNAPFLYEQLRPVIATRTTAEWLDFCAEHAIPVGQVCTLESIIETFPIKDHPHAGRYRSIPSPVWFSKTPASVRLPAPLVGQNTREILQSVGYSDSQIAHLATQMIIRVDELTVSEPVAS